MKFKKFSQLFALLVLIITIFTSCTKSNTGRHGKELDFASNGSKVFINTKSSNVLSLNIALFSNNKISDVKYIGLEGSNINNADFDVNIIDNTVNELNRFKYKGLYTKYIMLEITKKNEAVQSCEFNKLVLNVDGERRDINFSTPVKHQFVEGNVFTEALEISVIPNEFAASFINNKDASAIYEFTATKDLTIERVYFDDFLEPIDIFYSINNSQPQSAIFPINVSNGDQINIGFSIDSKIVDSNSYVSTNLIFEYKTNNSDENIYNSVFVVFDPIYPLTDNEFKNIEQLIDGIFSNDE